jgi:hypothetical protein
MKHVFAYRILSNIGLECPDPKTEEGAGGRRRVFCPPFPFFEGEDVEGMPVTWDDGDIRPVAFADLGQRYRRYRLADLPAEGAMASSLRRWGQLSPVVACAHG